MKYSVSWLLKGSAHHLTYRNAVLRNGSVIVSAFPRSGSSWLSEILSSYYQLPCPRHYKLPTLNSNIVVHTHEVPKRAKSKIYYIKRNPGDVYVSLFIKRMHIVNTELIQFPDKDILVMFRRFLENETRFPYESPVRWGKHVQAAELMRNTCNATVIDYESMVQEPYKVLYEAIYEIDKNVRSDDLNQSISEISRMKDLNTISYTTTSVSKWENSRWYSNGNECLLEGLIE